ncbi:ATP-NAD kinase-like domain-containing protein [Scheffersomyces coipomensis]|uniref:ATP-NAD kinase-like domain-containing protein n=1 Tax=Scheffersomyces coipomensis TaxID=1788519 RepID=UPI00315D65A2
MTKNRIRIESINALKDHTIVQPKFVKTSVLSKLHHVHWSKPLQNIYIVKKPWNYNVRDAMIKVIEHLHTNYPSLKIIVNKTVADELWEEYKVNHKSTTSENSDDVVLYTGEIEDIVQKTDLIITLGGDGTILRAVSAFSNVNVPPVLSFSLGTLGFLLPFDFKSFESTFKNVYENKGQAIHRSRLECHLIRKENIQEEDPSMIHAMNDISLHRGSQPNLTALDIIIDNELLTTTTCDGVILSTPTGSTAYSLSAGGSISHPSVPCILLTPICPRSLSFRPLILPSTSHIILRINESNRNGSINLSIDGITQADMKPGDQIHVNSDKNGNGKISNDDTNSGIWCFARSEHDWTKDINELLGFNSSFRAQKQHHI